MPHKVTVDRAYGGQGLGAELLDWAGTRAADEGAEWLRVDVWTNERLQHYYLRQGFTYVRTVVLAHNPSGALFQRPGERIPTPHLHEGVAVSCLPQSGHEAMGCPLVAAVLVTEHPGQLGLFDRHPWQQSQQWDHGAAEQGQPVARQGRTPGRPAAGRCRRVPDPPETTAWSPSTWTNVLNDPPSVITAHRRTAKPTQITTSPAKANASGAGVSSAGTHRRSRLPMKIDPPRESPTIRRGPPAQVRFLTCAAPARPC
jgi:Acetyltransferase (GNAT) family